MILDNMKPIYLDYQSTTPVDNEVAQKMLPYFTNIYGNPHSINHAFGKQANEAIEESRYNIAKTIGGESQEIIFTSGATESNNLAIKGAYLYRKRKEGRKKIIVSKLEHKCVIEAAHAMQLDGAEVLFLNVDKDGLVDLEQLECIIDDNVALVSIILANNEIGTLQPLKKISNLCKKYNVWLHTDAAQALGNIDIDVNTLGVDLLSISGHKIYAPKGVGALFVRRRPRIRLVSQIDGGGQERLIRSGTLPTPLIVGLGEAIKLIDQNIKSYVKHNLTMRNLLYEMLKKLVDKVSLNGPAFEETRLCNNLNLMIEGLDASKMVNEIGDKVAFSTGSACSTGGIEPSYVLKAIGLKDKEAMSSFRISVGRFTSKDEIELASRIIANNININK